MSTIGSYTYDANGNTLSDAQGRSFTWDFENRLTQVVNPGVGTTTLKYDPFGRRIQKSGPLGTTNYLYDGDNLLEEVDNAGNVLARYTQGKNVDQPLAVLRSGTTSYYQADALGSITSVTNLSATIAATYAYDTFGNLSGSSGSLTNPLRYTARELDTETGLYYHRARYYDPRVGRFVSEDPIGFDGSGINFYSYVGNSPNVFFDPMGLAAWAANNSWTPQAQQVYSSFAASYVQSYGGQIDCADLALMTLIAFASTNGLPLNLRYYASGHWQSYDAQSDDFTSVEQYTQTVTTNMGAINIIDNTHPILPNDLRAGDLLMSRAPRGAGYTGHTRIVTNMSCNKCNNNPNVTWLQGNLPPAVPQRRSAPLSDVPGGTLPASQIPRRWNFGNW